MVRAIRSRFGCLPFARCQGRTIKYSVGGPNLIFELSAGTVTDKGVTPATAAAGIVLEALKDFGDAGAKDSEWKAAAGVDSGQLSRSRYYDVKRDLLENGIASLPGGRGASSP